MKINEMNCIIKYNQRNLKQKGIMRHAIKNNFRTMHLRYYIALILFILGSLNYAAAEGRDKMTEVTDTFQLGRYVVELSLPKESVIALAKESIPEVPRMGGILLDSLNKKEAGPIYILRILQ